MQTARLYIHLNITRCTYSAVVYSPSSECAKLTGPTWLRCTHWPPCLLVSEMPFDCNDWSRILLKQFKNPPFFDPQSLFYQTFLDPWLLIVSLSLVGGLDGTTTGCRITMVAWLQLCVLNMAATSKQIAEHANMDHFNNHVKLIWLSKRLNYKLLILEFFLSFCACLKKLQNIHNLHGLLYCLSCLLTLLFLLLWFHLIAMLMTSSAWSGPAMTTSDHPLTIIFLRAQDMQQNTKHNACDKTQSVLQNT